MDCRNEKAGRELEVDGEKIVCRKRGILLENLDMKNLAYLALGSDILPGLMHLPVFDSGS